MTRDPETIVIVGGGMTAGHAVVTLREEGFTGRLTLISDEPGLPLGRPPLSKEYLRGEEDLSKWLVKPAIWYEENRVDIVRGAVTLVDPPRHRFVLRSGDSFGYDRLLIATGGRNRRIKAEGADLPGLFQLRTVASSDSIREAAQPGAHAVVVGMGFIGSEVAASLRQMGVTVTVVLAGRFPLASVLGDEVGAVMAAIHRDHGVELVENDEVVAFHGAKHLERVSTRAGRRIECNLAIAAVGIEPNVDALLGSGVAVDNGVLVDSRCESSLRGIFAAGDVANQLHPLFGRVRVEHYNNAEKQGAAAARSMVGLGGAYDYMHSFWSDQYDDKLEYVGHATNWDRILVRGSLAERRFLAFYLKQDRLKAAVGLNRGGDPEEDDQGDLAKAGRLIASGHRLAVQELANDGLDLDSIRLVS